MPKDRNQEDAEVQLKALSHPVRVEIMETFLRPEYADKSVSPREISQVLEQHLSNVSYHVRVLEECDAIKLVRTKPVRGSMQHFYRPSEKFTESPIVAFVLGLEPAADAA